MFEAIISFAIGIAILYATERGKTVIQEGLKQASTPLTIDGTTFVRTEPSGRTVDLIVIPVKAFGVKYVPAGRNQTVVVLRVGERAWANAYLGVLYVGQSDGTAYNATSLTYDPTGKEFDQFVGFQLASQTVTGESCDVYVNETYSAGHSKGLVTGVVLAIANSNGDEALDTGEKDYALSIIYNDDGDTVLEPTEKAFFVIHLDTATANGQHALLPYDIMTIEVKGAKGAALTIERMVPGGMLPDSYVNLG